MTNEDSLKANQAARDAREKLEELAEKAKDKAASQVDKTKEIERDATKIIDEAENTVRAIPYLRHSVIENQIDLWETTNRQLDNQNKALSLVTVTNSTASGTITIVNRSLSKIEYYDYDHGDEVESAQVEEIRLGFNKLEDLERAEENASKRAIELGLDIAPEGKLEPSKQFKAALVAFTNQVVQDFGPPNTSLIPLREGISILIENLLKNRKEQEPVKNEREKIRSVMGQLKHSELDSSYIDYLANIWHDLNRNKLSANKQTRMSREHWAEILHDGFVFVDSLLGSIDQSKMRS